MKSVPFDVVRFVSASWMSGEKHGLLLSGVYGVPVIYVDPIVYSLIVTDTEAVIRSLPVKAWETGNRIQLVAA